METAAEKILNIKINYSDAIRKIAEYKTQLDVLRKVEVTLKENVTKGRISREKYNLKLAETKAAAAECRYGMSVVEKEMRNNIRTEKEQKGSLKALRAELSNLTASYDTLSKTEREAAKGMELKDKINAITNELKGAEEETQRFYRNVGNYEDTIRNALGVNNSFANSLLDIAQNSEGAKSFFSGLDSSVKAFGKTLLSLMANPAFLAVIGLVGVGTAFKFWYDYNKGLVEATKLTDQFTGKSGDDLKEYRNEVLALADVYDKDFKEVLLSANSLAKQFGITQDEALTLIKDGFVAGADSNGEFLRTLKEYPTFFKEAGISASEFVAITAQASDSGVFSDKAVDAIKEGNIRLREMTVTTADALDGIGISSKKVQEELSSGAKTTFDIMQEVSQKLNELPASSSKVGTAIADIFGGAGEDAGLQYLQTLKDIDTNLDNVKSRTGVLGKLQEEQLNSQIELENALSSLFDITGGDFETMTTEAKTFANDALVSIINGVKDIVGWFKDLYDSSMLVRGGVASIQMTFNTLYNVLKFFFGYVIANTKALGSTLKSVFTLDFDALEQGVKQWKDTTEKLTTDFAKSMKKNVSGAIDDVVNRKIPPVKLTVETKTKNSTSTEETNSVDTAKQAEEKRKAAIKAAKEALATKKEQADKEREAVRQAEDSMLSLVKDGVEKQRQEVNNSYDRQIEDLKSKIATEKSLTATAKGSLNETIESLEARRTQELSRISDEAIAEQIAKEQKRIELMLSSVKSGSEQEYQLKMQQLIKSEEAELAIIGDGEEKKKEIRERYAGLSSAETDATKLATLRSAMNAELATVEEGEANKLLIKQKYAAQMDALTDTHNNDIIKKQQDALRLEFETKIAQAYGNEEEILRIKMEQKQAELNAIQQLEGESLAAFNLRKLELGNESLDAEKELAAKETEIKQTKFQAISDITNGLATLAEAAGEHSKGLAIASKVLALAEIAINTGKAIAAGIAQAQSVPFPGNIAAIATTVSTVLANIATATKTVKSVKLATGGAVIGPGSGTSDSIPAQLSNGESVMTATATSMFAPLLSSFNMMGGGIPINITGNSSQAIGEEMLAQAIAKGFMMAPPPVLSVEEFTSVANRTKFVENLGDI